MPSSDQQPPVDENGQQAADTTNNLDNTDNLEVVPEVELDPVSFAEAVHQGLIYPPPPSYYENMPENMSENIPLPAQATQAVGREVISFVPQAATEFVPPSQGAEPAYRPPQPQWERPAAPAPGLYPPPWAPQSPLQPAQPLQKRSRKWVWIVVSVLGVALFASCGLCSWGVYTLFNAVYQPVVSSINVADDFYSNVQNQDYSAAYADLAPQGRIAGLTLIQFTQQATQVDTQFGPVTAYVPGQPSFSNNSNGPDLSIVTLTMSITRTHSSTYSSLLTLQQEGGTWKIIDYDRI